MGKHYSKMPDSRKWMVDALAVFVISHVLVGLVAWMCGPGK
jgi:hypothetical protein